MAYLVPSKTNVPSFVTFPCKVTPDCTTKVLANILKCKKTVVRFMDKILCVRIISCEFNVNDQQNIKNTLK